MTSRAWLSWMPLVAAVAGCRGAAAPPVVATAAPSARAAADDGWSTASWEDHHDTMTFLVLPTMARTFQRFDGRPYPTMTCATCHGANAEQTRYRMPAAGALPALDPDRLPSVRSSSPAEARMAHFMTDVVTPQLADLLDEPRVSCFTCHARRVGAR